ncbi:hypothetical protein BWI97_05900 [Siphonobacter sp. BAB-5405]|nr:hypothetical protein BWI97_05900 [Siphonobacter sp. BAB-5405]
MGFESERCLPDQRQWTSDWLAVKVEFGNIPLQIINRLGVWLGSFRIGSFEARKPFDLNLIMP